MKKTLTIGEVMSRQPHTIGPDIPVTKAVEFMREFRVRHLPVQTGGKLVGVISDRDLKLATGFETQHALTVEDVMSQDPYVVTPETPVVGVAREMARQKLGSAIITEKDRVVGIFTANDALEILAEKLSH